MLFPTFPFSIFCLNHRGPYSQSLLSKFLAIQIRCVSKLFNIPNHLNSDKCFLTPKCNCYVSHNIKMIFLLHEILRNVRHVRLLTWLREYGPLLFILHQALASCALKLNQTVNLHLTYHIAVDAVSMRARNVDFLIVDFLIVDFGLSTF